MPYKGDTNTLWLDRRSRSLLEPSVAIVSVGHSFKLMTAALNSSMQVRIQGTWDRAGVQRMYGGYVCHLRLLPEERA